MEQTEDNDLYEELCREYGQAYEAYVSGDLVVIPRIPGKEISLIKTITPGADKVDLESELKELEPLENE